MQTDAVGAFTGPLEIRWHKWLYCGQLKNLKLRESTMWKMMAVAAVTLPILGVAAKAEDTVKVGVLQPACRIRVAEAWREGVGPTVSAEAPG